MDLTLPIALLLALIGVGALAVAFLVIGRRGGGEQADAHVVALAERLAQMTEAQAAQQAQPAQTPQAQERALARSVDERMQFLTKRNNETREKTSPIRRAGCGERGRQKG